MLTLFYFLYFIVLESL
ncbi:hypothetical protein F383_35034 [Gossypium arboreum]|uniref:Uncharacterized protein n=1 Tax=Gossypium arboreum TaxID=29729 RepID=A0A0B0N5K5_GOSAR|nr:hypothetical protein F383_35034 [Gossypium arboreum]